MPFARSLGLFAPVVVICALSGGCGGNNDTPASGQVEGGAQIIYQSDGAASAETLGQAADVLRARLNSDADTDHADVSVRADTIVVRLPGVRDKRQARAVAAQLATPGRLAFIDWEPNVLGPRCKPDIFNQQVTGGAQAGSAMYGLARYEAVRRAAGCLAPSGAPSTLVPGQRRQAACCRRARHVAFSPARGLVGPVRG